MLKQKFIIKLIGLCCWQLFKFYSFQFQTITTEEQKLYLSFEINSLSPEMYLSFHHISLYSSDLQKPPKPQVS